jgi:hypothetical protein
VLSSAGIEAGDYSFAYMAGWSDGEPERVAKAADRVITCARSILDQLGLDHEGAIA